MDHWEQLAIGDRVRIHSMPTDFVEPTTLHFETREIYEWLIETGLVLTVNQIESPNLPWADFVRVVDGVEEHHSLMLNHDGLERA